MAGDRHTCALLGSARRKQGRDLNRDSYKLNARRREARIAARPPEGGRAPPGLASAGDPVKRLWERKRRPARGRRLAALRRFGMPSRMGVAAAALLACSSQVLLSTAGHSASLSLLRSSPRVPGSLSQRGEVLLPPPRNVTLLSKDFGLFLTWLPGIHYPPGVFYIVQWMNAFAVWEDFLPCRNISETVCNITCTSPDLYNGFDVRVKAQAGILSSEWVTCEGIDYAVDVKLTPPVVQVRKTGDTVMVNATFSDPLCLKDLFRDLTSDLEFWEVGINNRKKINMKNTKDFDTTVFNGSSYCFSARANLNGMHSNFSEPTCIQLYKEVNTWAFALLPVLLLFILFLWVIHSVYQSRSKPKTTKSPQTLDFSSYKAPKKFLEFPKKEFIDVLTCPEHPVILENRSRITPQIRSKLIPSVLEEYEEEEEEDIGNSRPYTEIHRFQKNDVNSQGAGLLQKVPDSSSESETSQLGEGSVPDLTMSGFFGLTKPVFGEMTSGPQGSEIASLSVDSSAEESSVCRDFYPAARGDQQKDLDKVTGSLFQLSDSNLLPGNFFTASESFCETLGDPQISLLEVRTDQDFWGLLEDEKLSEKDSCGWERLVVELSPLNMPLREGLGSSLVGGNGSSVEDSTPHPKSHGYQPRPVHYLSRILQG